MHSLLILVFDESYNRCDTSYYRSYVCMILYTVHRYNGTFVCMIGMRVKPNDNKNPLELYIVVINPLGNPNFSITH